ncbi:MAG: hypothetical protein ABI002_07820 [Saprospiraceae bacterium]
MAFYAISLFLFSCGKDEKKEILFTELVGSADSTDRFVISYGLNGEVSRIDKGSYSIQYFQKEGKIAYRKTFSGSSLSSVDTVFTDATGKILKADTYDDAGTKESTTTLSYNSNNTLNSATIDYVDSGSDDISFEYLYLNGTISQKLRYRKVGSEYKLVQKDEILTYDDMENPWDEILMPYLVLNIDVSAIVWAGPNHNPQSIKSSDIDPISGAVTNVTLNTLSYQYNDDGFPSEIFIDGVSTYKYRYILK